MVVSNQELAFIQAYCNRRISIWNDTNDWFYILVMLNFTVFKTEYIDCSCDIEFRCIEANLGIE